jgi:hypothetical protein
MAGILLFSQWRLRVIFFYNSIIFIFLPNSKALDVYTELSKKPNYDLNIHTNKACCLYALARYKEAFDEAKKGSNSELNVIPYKILFKSFLG